MGRGLPYIIVIAVVVLIVAATAEVSVRSATCMACHTQEAQFATWMADKLKTEKRGFSHELLGCADCHIEGAPGRTAMSKLRGLLHAVTYLEPQIDPRKAEISGLFHRSRIPRENCAYCHLGAEKRIEVRVKDLPPGLQKIGLKMDHRKHVLAREDTCARCHERYKDKGTSEADKGVNYAEVNHLACDSCHTLASHAYRKDLMLPITNQEYVTARDAAWNRLATNPRWPVAIPSEYSCRRCHNGKVHYKTPIFNADCREGKNYDNCLKCHPLMTREYFEQYLKDREKMLAAETGN